MENEKGRKPINARAAKPQCDTALLRECVMAVPLCGGSKEPLKQNHDKKRQVFCVKPAAFAFKYSELPKICASPARRRGGFDPVY